VNPRSSAAQSQWRLELAEAAAQDRRQGGGAWPPSQLGRSDEALAVFEEADRRFGDECVAELASLASLASIGLIDLREQAARALVNKAETLLRLERPGDAIAACEEFGERFGDDIEPEFGERITIVRDRSRSR
jgi:hypothetical protein